MNHLEIFNTILNNLVPTSFSPENTSQTPQEVVNDLPIEECTSWKELCLHWKKNFFFTNEIRDTLAVISAVVLSTDTEGGQLALRVLGPPGAAKSTLAECFAQITELVYPVSKFTGIVSGWGSVTNQDQMASRINNKCLFVKDADPMMQLTNLPQIESELRDGLGDAVIRADYKTGRSLNIKSLFTVILCGTNALKGIDNALLGARFLDCVVHDRNTSTEQIVKTAIKSQGEGIIKKLTRNKNGDSPDNIDSDLKPIIRKLAPKTIAFIKHKKQYIDEGKVDIDYPSKVEEERIYAAAELISYVRAKADMTRSGELKYRVDRELATRLGELLIRLYLFLQIVLKEEN